MTKSLRNCLKDYKNKYVKVGSKGGISFWYCDKMTNFTYKAIQDISDNFHNQLKHSSRTKKYRLQHLDEIYDLKIAKQVEKAKTSPKIKRKLGLYIANCNKKRERERELLPKQIMTIGGQIKKWGDLLERKVVDIYPSISPDEPNTMVIMVRGQEKGKYWTTKEYQDRNKDYVRGVHDGTIK